MWSTHLVHSLVPMPDERRIGGSAVKPSRTQFSCEGYAAASRVDDDDLAVQ